MSEISLMTTYWDDSDNRDNINPRALFKAVQQNALFGNYGTTNIDEKVFTS